MNTANWEFCYRHQVMRLAGEQCGQCAAEATAAHQRDVVTVLEARIADLVAENLDLRRRVSALEHRMNHLQLVYTRLAAHVDPKPELLP